ncbi:hypothetical protein GOV05_01205 [Candidatus Woesearchaeota archaeon]|nr:hypothetical protein [Candidatus Woesearchaeota archaeon]
MAKKFLMLTTLLILSFFLVGCASQSQEVQKQENKENTNVVVQEEITSTAPPLPNPPISREALSQHNNVDDCWVVYQQEVYDITNYLPEHPGSSAAIEPFCGSYEDFENVFTGKHGTSKVKTLMNQGIRIGTLK